MNVFCIDLICLAEFLSCPHDRQVNTINTLLCHMAWASNRWKVNGHARSVKDDGMHIFLLLTKSLKLDTGHETIMKRSSRMLFYINMYILPTTC